MACSECAKKAEEFRQSREPHKVIAWKAWYTEGRTFCSCDVKWAELPEDGALGFKLFFAGLAPDGNNMSRMMSGDDWYWNVGEIYAHDSGTTKEEIERRYPRASVKRGMWVSDAEIQYINDELAKASL